MQKINSASLANSGVRFRAACGRTGTLNDPKTSAASGVSGAPTLADTPALNARMLTVSSDSKGIPRRLAISASAIAAAIGEIASRLGIPFESLETVNIRERRD